MAICTIPFSLTVDEWAAPYMLVDLPLPIKIPNYFQKYRTTTKASVKKENTRFAVSNDACIFFRQKSVQQWNHTIQFRAIDTIEHIAEVKFLHITTLNSKFYNATANFHIWIHYWFNWAEIYVNKFLILTNNFPQNLYFSIIRYMT